MPAAQRTQKRKVPATWTKPARSPSYEPQSPTRPRKPSPELGDSPPQKRARKNPSPPPTDDPLDQLSDLESDLGDLTNPPLPDSPIREATPQPKAELDELADFAAQMQKKYNVDLETVEWALERTSATKALVEIVLDLRSKGEGLPTHLRGIWSEEQDKVVLGGDSKALMKLEKEKGDVAERFDFLEKWRSAALDEEED